MDLNMYRVKLCNEIRENGLAQPEPDKLPVFRNGGYVYREFVNKMSKLTGR